MQLYAQPEVPSPASVAELERRKSIQQQLVLLLHAYRCRKEELRVEINSEVWHCSLQRCSVMKEVLSHLQCCEAGKHCTVTHCVFTRQVLIHWKECTLDNCAYCLPVIQLDINMAYNLNDSDKYNTDLKHVFDLYHIPTSDMSGSLLKETTIKDYLPDLTADRRAHVVQKVALALLPGADASIYIDKRWHRLLAYASKLEADMFQLANTSSEYYHLLAVKIFDLKEQLDLKRKLRRQQQRDAEGYPTPPDSRSRTPPLR